MYNKTYAFVGSNRESSKGKRNGGLSRNESGVPALRDYEPYPLGRLDAGDFKEITTYEECRFCKPNPEYFRQILEKFDLDPAQCLMVGNDVEEDLAIRSLGVSTYLVTDTMEDRKGLPFESEYTGTLKDLLLFIRKL